MVLEMFKNRLDKHVYNIYVSTNFTIYTNIRRTVKQINGYGSPAFVCVGLCPNNTHQNKQNRRKIKSAEKK